MGKINKEWHQANPMPANASIEQRILWHLDHTRFCACREIPCSLRDEMIRRGYQIPTTHERVK